DRPRGSRNLGSLTQSSELLPESDREAMGQNAQNDRRAGPVQQVASGGPEREAGEHVRLPVPAGLHPRNAVIDGEQLEGVDRRMIATELEHERGNERAHRGDLAAREALPVTREP